MKLTTLEKIAREIAQTKDLRNGRMTQREMWDALRAIKARTKEAAKKEIEAMLFR